MIVKFESKQQKTKKGKKAAVWHHPSNRTVYNCLETRGTFKQFGSKTTRQFPPVLIFEYRFFPPHHNHTIDLISSVSILSLRLATQQHIITILTL